jgi:hypothetical protein
VKLAIVVWLAIAMLSAGIVSAQSRAEATLVSPMSAQSQTASTLVAPASDPSQTAATLVAPVSAQSHVTATLVAPVSPLSSAAPRLASPVSAQSQATVTLVSSVSAQTAATLVSLSVQPQAAATLASPLSDHALKIPAFVWAAGVAADQITTYRFSSRYGDLLHERNPLILGLDRHPVLLVAAGSAIDAATGWAVYHYLGRHPRLAKVAFYGAAAYRGYLAIYNVQMMRQARQMRVTAARASVLP